MLSTVSTCSRCKVFSKQTSIPHTHSRSLTASHVKGMKPLIAIHPSKPSPTFATQSDLAHPGTKLVESDPLLSTEKEIEYDDYEENEVEEESSVDQDLEPNAYEEKQPPEDELSMSEEQTLQIGDEVVIRVKNFHPLGVIVKIVNHPGVEGFLPTRWYPLKLRYDFSRIDQELPEKFLRRNATYKAIICGEDKSPFITKCRRYVVSALRQNQKIIFQRFSQLFELCLIEKEILRGYITGRNRGGLLVTVAGCECFMPKSQCGEDFKGAFLSRNPSNFIRDYMNKEIEVILIEVIKEEKRITVSRTQAIETKRLRDLKIGSLIRGFIRNIVSYGAFVEIDGTKKSGLLHVRNISQNIVQHPKDVFRQGELIYAVVLDMEPDKNRFSLSTADLESTHGEIIYDKETVMKNAPKMAKRLQKELEEAGTTQMTDFDDE